MIDLGMAADFPTVKCLLSWRFVPCCKKCSAAHEVSAESP